MTQIYTFSNQKGGVGKTTSTINLGAYLAYYGQRVLIVDLDPQANASSSLDIDKESVRSGTYEVLLGTAPIAPNILNNPRLKLSILPSSPALSGAEVELLDIPNRETRLREALAPVVDRYDYILIDCPPSFSILTINGLLAAQSGVIIPVQCEYLALEGLGQLTATVNRVRSSLFPELEIRGVILTMFDVRTRLALDVVNEIRRYFPKKVFKSMIPRSVRLAEAPSYGVPISAYAPSSSGGKAYNALALEVLEQNGVHIQVPEIS
jgi:chromosome partitioning protein